MAINLSPMIWHDPYFCIFSDFSLTAQVIAKIRKDRAEVVVVVPDWSSQYSYLQFVDIRKQTSLSFWPSPTNLILPCKP